MLSLQAACKNSPDDEDAFRAIDLLYDAALVSSGFTVSTHGPPISNTQIILVNIYSNEAH